MRAPSSRTPQRSQGFTVIETIIVLAIAGFILSIVLFAIPALQRNSRNTQRKQEVSAILQAVSRYELNNSGNYPISLAELMTKNYYQIGFYNAADISISTVGKLQPVPAVDTSKVRVLNYYRCNDTGTGASSAGAGYHDTVALYGIEASSGLVPKCMQL